VQRGKRLGVVSVRDGRTFKLLVRGVLFNLPPLPQLVNTSQTNGGTKFRRQNVGTLGRRRCTFPRHTKKKMMDSEWNMTILTRRCLELVHISLAVADCMSAIHIRL
jgi:hypothetical protein